jgi:hypothetical protein
MKGMPARGEQERENPRREEGEKGKTDGPYIASLLPQQRAKE